MLSVWPSITKLVSGYSTRIRATPRKVLWI
ncbi:Uncharacterised protein [Vibrio cholerae]|nr:Uncharacterised protein [Vibrio cholerae]